MVFEILFDVRSEYIFVESVMFQSVKLTFSPSKANH